MLSEEDFIRELTASQDRLFAFILTLLPDVNGAGDVLQETHIEMWRKRQQFAKGTHFIAWACQIARYKVFEHRRTMGREKLVFDEELVHQLAKDAGRNAEHGPERLGILEACLARLSPRQRALIGERYGLGRSVKEIAQQVGRSASALAVALFRIRQALLDCIERKLSEGTHE
jgi:RNA polymerase sigma-70 factor, ECF subfamily